MVINIPPFGGTLGGPNYEKDICFYYIFYVVGNDFYEC